MAKYKDGELISLVWDSCTLDAYYVKGHFDFDDAKETILSEECFEDNQLDGKPFRHAYARWSTQGDAPEGCTVVLRDYKEPGRGRFKVTVCDMYNPAKE